MKERFAESRLRSPRRWGRAGILLGCCLLVAQPRLGSAFVLAVKETIDFKGNAVETDSYDSSTDLYSTDGRYDPAKRKAGGDVIGAGVTNSIVNVGFAKIAGHVVTGIGGAISIGSKGSAGDLPWVAGTNGIQPGYWLADMRFPFKNVMVPVAGWIIVGPSSLPGVGGSGMVDGTNYDHIFRSTGDYEVADSGTIYVGTNILVRLKTTAIDFAPDSIYVAGTGSEASTLKVYLTGPSAMLRATHQAQSGRATSLRFYGLPSCTSLTYAGNGDFTGVVYAPEADFQLAGGGSSVMNFAGTSVTRTVSVNGRFHFHADEMLDNGGFEAGPPSQATVVGRTAQFELSAAIPYRCQWQFAGTNIPGATDPILTLSNVQLSDTGDYTVTVTMIAGTYTSSPLHLQVYASPIASLDSPALAGDHFQFTVSGVPGFCYAIEASADLTSWIPLRTNFSPFTFIETNNLVFPQRFYRVAYVP